MGDELLCMNNLPLVSFFLWIGAIFFSSLFLSFFDMPCGHVATFFGYASFILNMPKHVAYLLWVCIFYFEHAEACGISSLGMHLLFPFFCITSYPLSNFMREMSYGDMELFFGGCISGYIAHF